MGNIVTFHDTGSESRIVFSMPKETMVASTINNEEHNRSRSETIDAHVIQEKRMRK